MTPIRTLVLLLAALGLSAPAFAQDSNPCAPPSGDANPCANPCAPPSSDAKADSNPCANPCAKADAASVGTAPTSDVKPVDGGEWPEGMGLWEPATDTWSKEGMTRMLRIIEIQPIPGDFIADVEGMTEYKKANWAWFADDFDPQNYSSVAIAPVRNSLGRYHVTGQDLMAQRLWERVKVFGPKPWKKSMTQGTEGDLVLYMNIRAFKVTTTEFQVVAELIGVDKADHVVLKLQIEAGKSMTAQVVMGAMTGSMSAIPDEADQFEQIDATALEVSSRFHSALVGAYKSAKKGEPNFPMGPAQALPLKAEFMVDQQVENFGDALQKQVVELLAVANNVDEEIKLRRNAVLDLGKFGATGVVEGLKALAADKKQPKKLKQDIVWALGESGHPDAIGLIKGVKGVSGKIKSYAVTKIEEY